MKSSIKSLALLLTILGLIGFGWLVESQAGDAEVPLTYSELIGDPGGESTFESPLSIPEGTSLQVTADVSMEVSIEIIDKGTGALVFPDGLISETGVLTGTLTVSGLEAGKTYVLKETYEGQAVPKAIIPLDTYVLSLDNTLTHEFTATGPTYEIVIDAEVTDLVLSVEGDLSVDDTTKTFATLDDKLIIKLKPTIDVVANETTLTYTSGFTALFSKDTTLGIRSDPPVLNSVTIGVDPAGDAFTNSTLGVVSFDGTDENWATVVPSAYQWLKDGSEIPGATGATLSGDYFAKGDKISLRLTVKDEGGKESAPKVSDNEIEIGDSLASAPTIAIVPRGAPADTAPTAAHDLLCQIVTESVDPDGEPVTYTYQWGKTPTGGTKTPQDVTGAVVDKSLLTKGDSWSCQVTPVSAGENGTPSTEVSVTIQNSPPVMDDIPSQTVNEGATLEVPINATNLDGDTLTRTITNNGGVTGADAPTISGDNFTWTPNKTRADASVGYSNYTFEVEVSDGTASDKKTFTVTVYNINQLVSISVTSTPASGTAVVDDDISVDLGTEITFAVTITDEDTDNQWFRTASISPTPTGSTFNPGDFNTGTETPQSDTSKSFTWTPAGADGDKNFTITFTIKDNAKPVPSAAIKRIVVSVGTPNLKPKLTVQKNVDGAGLEDVGNVAVAVNEGQTLVLKASATNRTNDSGIGFTITVKGPSGTISNLTVPSDPAVNTDLTVTWDPIGTTAAGVYSFGFAAKDNTDSSLVDSKVVIVNVAAVNNDPVLSFTNFPTAPTDEGDTITFTITAEDADLQFGSPPINPLTLSVTGMPSGATLGDATYDSTATPPSMSRDFSWTPDRNVVPYDDADNQVEIDMTFTVDDGEGGTVTSPTKTITISNVNEDPEILSVTGVKTIKVGETLTITVKAKDADKEPLTISRPTSGPTVNNGTWVTPTTTFDQVTGTTTAVFKWTAGSGFPSSETVTFTATDNATPAGTDTSDVTFEISNRTPSITSVTGDTVSEGSTLTIDVTATDDDTGDLAGLTLEIAGLPSPAPTIPSSTDGTWTATWGPVDYDIVAHPA